MTKWRNIPVLLLVLMVSGCGQATSVPPPPSAPTPTDGPNPTVTARPQATSSPAKVTTAWVVAVVDGDTIKVNFGGQVYRVRYIGIDTPETKHPDRGVEWMGPEAAAYNEQLVGGKVVFLEKDVSETDQYGRLLRYVWVDDVMVNAELVRQGYAVVGTWPPDVKYHDILLGAQREAREAGRGLWGSPP
jgi:micrococcal nuclease